jgi:HAMP domain-containing protein
MTLDRTFLKSKVGRRIFLLFVSSTLVPITALAMVAFGHVSRELTRQTHQRLHQVSKGVAMSATERLVEAEKTIRAFAEDGPQTPERHFHISGKPHLDLCFSRVSTVGPAGDVTGVLGEPIAQPELSVEQQSHIADGHAIVTAGHDGERQSILMIVAGQPDGGQSFVIGELLSEYLWQGVGIHTTTSPAAVSVLEGRTVLHSTHRDPAKVVTAFLDVKQSKHTGHFEWSGTYSDNIAGYWTVFLKSMYQGPEWTIIVSENKATVLAPISDFKRTFPFVVLLSIGVVLLLSVVLIRRSLVPLGQLREATERIASGDLDVRVAVSSSDEFQQLGDAFNGMAQRLATQFKALTTIAEVDRVILASLDRSTIIETVLRQVPSAFPAEAIMLSLLK